MIKFKTRLQHNKKQCNLICVPAIGCDSKTTITSFDLARPLKSAIAFQICFPLLQNIPVTPSHTSSLLPLPSFTGAPSHTSGALPNFPLAPLTPPGRCRISPVVPLTPPARYRISPVAPLTRYQWPLSRLRGVTEFHRSPLSRLRGVTEFDRLPLSHLRGVTEFHRWPLSHLRGLPNFTGGPSHTSGALPNLTAGPSHTSGALPNFTGGPSHTSGALPSLTGGPHTSGALPSAARALQELTTQNLGAESVERAWGTFSQHSKKTSKQALSTLGGVPQCWESVGIRHALSTLSAPRFCVAIHR